MLENQPKKGPGKWSRKRQAAISALLTYDTIAKAAKHIRVAESTLYRWQRDPDFQREYQNAKDRIIERATDALRSGAMEAVSVLREVIGNRKAPCASRVMAARTFLESTALLKGNSVTVNNQVVPQDQETLTAEIVKQLSGMLRTDARLRDAVKSVLAEVESEEQDRKPN
jgi:hypothetical protein